MAKIPTEYYLTCDVVALAQSLIGALLCTNIDNQFCKAMIVETEAYKAPEDSASHAYNHRKTPRTQTMFHEGGRSYVYLIYGVHCLFNIVTAPKGIPHAVLVRGVEPLEGVNAMLQRRKLQKPSPKLTAGPGLLTRALGIGLAHNNISLQGQEVWLEEYKKFTEQTILKSPRVGLGKSVVEPYFSIPWRFRLKDNTYTSPAQ